MPLLKTTVCFSSKIVKICSHPFKYVRYWVFYRANSNGNIVLSKLNIFKDVLMCLVCWRIVMGFAAAPSPTSQMTNCFLY